MIRGQESETRCNKTPSRERGYEKLDYPPGLGNQYRRRETYYSRGIISYTPTKQRNRSRTPPRNRISSHYYSPPRRNRSPPRRNNTRSPKYSRSPQRRRSPSINRQTDCIDDGKQRR